MDLESGAEVFVGDGKGADALLPFQKRLRAAHAKIEVVATHLSNATLVFDRFHIMKLFNEKLSQLRRDLQSEATDGPMKKSIRGTRQLLLKNPENLDATRNEPQRLAEILKLNEPLAMAYYLKDDLREVWNKKIGRPHKITC